MNLLKSPITLFAMLTMLIAVGCSSTPSSQEVSPSPIASTPSPEPSAAAKRSSSPTAVLPSSEKTVLVNIYRADNQCQKLVAEKVAVSANQPMEAAISKILAEQDSADFSVTGFRLSVQDAVAIVDLRVAPGSKRSFQSLSSCEQLALFGSLRQTLMGNPQWQIQSVQFLDKGQEIVL